MPKKWMEYREYLAIGEWHIHTTWSDGNNTVFEICEKAVEEGVPLLVFTEHVRKKIDYDFSEFLIEIERAREHFDLIILSGCEAKVLPGGGLDVEEWILQKVDYPLFAFHSFPSDIELYLNSLKVVLKNNYVNAWAHPGYFLSRQGLELPDKELMEIFSLLHRHNVLLEINKKYSLPPSHWLDLAKRLGVNLVKGSDIHNVNDIGTS
jgi:putative hydrolase